MIEEILQTSLTDENNSPHASTDRLMCAERMTLDYGACVACELKASCETLTLCFAPEQSERIQSPTTGASPAGHHHVH